MLLNPDDVTRQFLSIFVGSSYDQSPLVKYSDGSTKNIPTRFYKSSSINYTEEERESYPRISIQDYTPEHNPMSDNDVYNYQTDEGNKDFSMYTGELGYRPFFMIFRFDVSFASLSMRDRDALRTYFLQNYGKRGVFYFNAFDGSGTDAQPIIEPCFYHVERAEVYREDGIFEDNYTFEVHAWVKSKEVVPVDLVQIVKWSINDIEGYITGPTEDIRNGLWYDVITWIDNGVWSDN